MKHTIQEVIDVSAGLDYLGQIEDLLCAYTVADNILLAKPHIELLKHDKKQLVDKHVLKNKDGSYKYKDSDYDFGANILKFEKEAEKLLAKTVEIDFITILKNDIKNGKGEKMYPPANVLVNLSGVILVDKE